MCNKIQILPWIDVVNCTCFISENCTSLGSALNVATRKVSPSTLEMLSVRSSDPRVKFTLKYALKFTLKFS